MSGDTKDILEKLLKARGWSEYRLAEESGVNQSTINAILNGRSKQQRDTTLQPLADSLGVTKAQLRGYEEIPKLLDATVAIERQLADKYPTVKEDRIHDYLVGNVGKDEFDHYTRSATAKGPRTFVWRADDNALAPAIEKGGLVFIDPDYQYDPELEHPEFKPALIEAGGHYSLRNEENDLGELVYRSFEKGYRLIDAASCTLVGYVVGIPESNWTDEAQRKLAVNRITG